MQCGEYMYKVHIYTKTEIVYIHADYILFLNYVGFYFGLYVLHNDVRKLIKTMINSISSFI